jgi:hypothetical protein
MKTNPQPEVSAFIALAVNIALAVGLVVGCAATGPADADSTCEGSLQGLIDAAAPGAVVEAAGGCVYRETVAIDKPLTLKAAPGGSEIRGSEIWDDAVWSQRGSTWVSGKAVPPSPPTARGNATPTRSGVAGPSRSSSPAGSSRR